MHATKMPKSSGPTYKQHPKTSMGFATESYRQSGKTGGAYVGVSGGSRGYGNSIVKHSL